MRRKSKKLKQRPDGRYVSYYNGKAFYGRSPEEAEEKKNIYKKACLEDRNPETVILSRYADRWLDINKTDISVRTRNQYKSLLNRLCDEVGTKRIQDIMPSDVQSVLAGMSGMSHSYIHKAVMLYREVFSAAMRDKIIYNNVTDGLSAPRGSVGTHRAIEDWERELIDTVPHRCRLAARLMLYEGLRRGEVLALQAKHIDLAECRIYVKRAVFYTGNRPGFHHGKNDYAYRSIPIFSRVLKELYDWKMSASPDDYVLPAACGGPCSETAFQRAWASYMNRLSEELNHDTRRWYGHRQNDNRDPSWWIQVDIRCHDLRHTFCSDSRDAGIEINVLRRWLGHSSERMILQVYDHVRPERERQEAELLNRHFSDENGRKNGRKNGQPDADMLQTQEIQPFHPPDRLTTNQKVVGSNPAGLTDENLED